jgi:hypothetical protein
MIRFKCPGCGRELKVDDGLAGRTGKCPSCKHGLTVPRTEAPNPLELEPLTESCPSCGSAMRSDSLRCAQCGYDRRTGAKSSTTPAPDRPQKAAAAQRTSSSSAGLEYVKSFLADHWKKLLVLGVVAGLIIAGVIWHRGYQRSKERYAVLRAEASSIIQGMLDIITKNDFSMDFPLPSASVDILDPPIFVSVPDQLGFLARGERLDPVGGDHTKKTSISFQGNYDHQAGKIVFTYHVMEGLRDFDRKGEAVRKSAIGKGWLWMLSYGPKDEELTPTIPFFVLDGKFVGSKPSSIPNP